MSDLSTQLLSAGACYEGNTFLKCALDPSECTSRVQYRSSQWLASNDPDRCDSSDSVRGLVAMGRCNSNTDRFMCTSDASACQLSLGWVPFDTECTVSDDSREQSEWTHSYFGECNGNGNNFCAWKSSDCPDDGYNFQWANPFFASQVPDCRCHDVKTGACVSDNDPDFFFCAATEDVCFTGTEAGMSYMKPLEVEAELGITCKLCDGGPQQQPVVEPEPEDNGFACDICPGRTIVNPDNVVNLFGFTSTCGGAAASIAQNAPLAGFTAETGCQMVRPEIPRFSCCGDAPQPAAEPEPEEPQEFVCDICPGGTIANPNNRVHFFGYEATCGGTADYIANTAPTLGYTAEEACSIILPEVPRNLCCGEYDDNGGIPPDAELTTSLVAAGACYHETTNEFIKCALAPLECMTSVYRSARWLATNDAERRCDSQESIHGLTALGRCNSSTDKYICTSDRSACQLSAGWDPFNEDCTVVDDLQPREFSHSYYGECNGMDNFCAWKSSDCPDDSYRFQWANPFLAGAVPDCRCDDVKTGACVSDRDPDDFFCATTAEVCASEVGTSYKKPLDVEGDLGITCKLCDGLNPPAASSSPPPPPTARPTRRPTFRPPPTSAPIARTAPPPTVPTYSSSSLSSSTSSNEEENPRLSPGAIGGITAAAIVGISVLVVVVARGSSPTPNQLGPAPEALVEPGQLEDMEPGQTEEDFIPQEDRSVT